MSHDDKADTRIVAVEVDPDDPEYETTWTDVPMIRESKTPWGLLGAAGLAFVVAVGWALIPWLFERPSAAERATCVRLCRHWGYSISKPDRNGNVGAFDTDTMCSCRPPCVPAEPGRFMSCEQEEAERARGL